jgi:lysophospholipase L1-like esterase
MMKHFIFSIFLTSLLSSCLAKEVNNFYGGNHKYVQYVGRVDFSNANRPRFWASGVYIQFRFSGTHCSAQINDEFRYGKVLNYLEIKIDGQPAYRIQLKEKENNIVLGKNLSKGEHTVIICKNTESENGYVEMVGLTCEKLLPPPNLQKRKMEFIGDSITCGFGSDESEIKCGDKNANWYDQHNAWLAYGPITARSLNAQWHLSSVSGIGLVHSCCEKKILMPQVYDKINMPENSIKWNFDTYQPDVVTICLGQNDGIQDSVKFCSAYVNFAKTLRGYYPKARLVFLTSPMADQKLKAALVKYITAVKENLNQNGDQNIGAYAFSKQSVKGCGSHPSLAEQQEIASELTNYLKKTMKW